jgi:hypothetical protein
MRQQQTKGGNMDTLKVGTRVYNRGDRANSEHFGSIVKVSVDTWGTHYRIRIDADCVDETGREEYTIPKVLVSEVDVGNGLSRIVTEDEHKRFVAERLEELKKRYQEINGATWYKWECDHGARWTITDQEQYTEGDECNFSGCDHGHQIHYKGKTKDRNEAHDWFRRPI